MAHRVIIETPEEAEERVIRTTKRKYKIYSWSLSLLLILIAYIALTGSPGESKTFPVMLLIAGIIWLLLNVYFAFFFKKNK